MASRKFTVSNILRVVVIIVATALTSYIVLFPKVDEPQGALPAPDFKYMALDGAVKQLADHKGKLVLVHFWASWCAPCKVEFPHLYDLAKAHPEKVVILAISVDQRLKMMEQFIDKMEAEMGLEKTPGNLEYTHDADMHLSQKVFHTFNFPETFIIGCDANMVDKVVGAEFEWEKRIAPHLAGCNGVLEDSELTESPVE